MKTIIYTTIALLFLNSSMLFAGGPNTSSTLKNLGFADGNEFKPAPEALISKLAPVTPKVAEFEETCTINLVSINRLMPKTPKVADFEEPAVRDNCAGIKIAPVTPFVADFKD